MERKIIIGKSFETLQEASGEGKRAQNRLVCPISVDGQERLMYFGVDPMYADGLTIGRADPFLVVMLNFAMRTKREITCQDPVSEKLLFGIRHQYMPFLSFWTDEFHEIPITAKTECGHITSQNAVGAAMSFGCDSMYTFLKHYNRTEYQITHLCNFNNGVYADREAFENHSALLRDFADERKIKSVCVDTNIQEILPERFLDVYSQRNVACVLALQGLFGTYLYASGHDEEHIQANPYNASYYDPVTMTCLSTENLHLILSGCETTRVEKMRYLCEEPDAQRYLHPCFKNAVGQKNCGHCKKDIREMVLLHAWNKEKLFDSVYDWKDFDRRLPSNLGFLLANKHDHLYGEVLTEYVKCGKIIPEQSYRYAEQFSKIIEKEAKEKVKP